MFFLLFRLLTENFFSLLSLHHHQQQPPAALALAARVLARECRAFSSSIGSSSFEVSASLRARGGTKATLLTSTLPAPFSRPCLSPVSSLARCSAADLVAGSSSRQARRYHLKSISLFAASAAPAASAPFPPPFASKMATVATKAANTPAASSSAPSPSPAAPPPASWDGSGTQEDLMLRDQVILVDESDAVLGGASKFAAHRFEESHDDGDGEGDGKTKNKAKTKANGLLHRAFSVFLFDSSDRLLLQRRASCKITFPDVWTNTCCSHQLHGQSPPEVDDGRLAAMTGEAPGAAAAAVRKLWHELGVEPGAVPVDVFKLVARLHYCAPDEENAEPWGEHELDYVLLARVPTGSDGVEEARAPEFSLAPNPEEVRVTRWVTRAELKEMLSDPALKWSPWFRIIVDKWLLPEWWSDGKLEQLLRSAGEERAEGVKEVHRVMCNKQ